MTQLADSVTQLEPRYSVIIPTLNEAAKIAGAIRSVKSQRPEVEIIVVDGGSFDLTTKLASVEGGRVVNSLKGRGTQCNAGVRMASGEVLLFLHADTVLPSGAFELLTEYFSDPRIQIGSFRLQFDEPNWLLSIYAAFTQLDSLFTRFGDQCIVVRKTFFEELGGFPDWPIFEDVHLLSQARRRTKIYSFPARVVTSARRFLQKGLVRCQLINGWLILQYLLGVSPEKLAQQYASDRIFEKSFLRLIALFLGRAMKIFELQIKRLVIQGGRSLRGFYEWSAKTKDSHKI